MKEIQVVGSYQGHDWRGYENLVVAARLGRADRSQCVGRFGQALVRGQIDQGHGSNQFGYYQAKSWAAIADLEI